MKGICLVLALLCLAAPPAFAQQTTGTITGRIVDAQGAAIPGATITATFPASGVVRTEVSDGEGLYRLAGLAIGAWDVVVELSGFTSWERKEVAVNVAQATDLNVELKVAGVAVSVNVVADPSLVRTTDSSVGGILDLKNIESLPLNGRQFANLAASIPGVGLGFHSDPGKTTQYTPQIGGGNGRNVNYQIDGGDNNDDTVGGLLQLFPLEAIQQFNFITQRYKAEYGRSNGGVMNIVTKSGTNDLHGSWFTSFRDRSMNAKTQTEKLSNVDKQEYRRYQYGGSFGGPIIQNRAHFFAAYERTQLDQEQAVSTLGLFPEQDGVYPMPSRENLFTVKATGQLTPAQFITVRYGRNTNSQVFGAGPRAVPENWGDSENTFNSINVNHNWVLKGSRLNEFVFQYADFSNVIGARTGAPQQTFPNQVVIGYNANTPQSSNQKKYQFRDDFSWHLTGKGGLGHDFKAGVNFINEPRLYVTFSGGSTEYAYTMLDNDINGRVRDITRQKPASSANIPMKQYGMYVQDDWKVRDRLTINAGLRYDLVTGFRIDQSNVPNYVILTNAAKAGRFNGVPGFEEFGKEEGEDKNNIQPRIGAAYDLHNNGKNVFRAGWGIYTDFGYTNANILVPALSAQGGAGTVFSATNTAGIRNPDGSFFRVGQPISNVASLNEVNPNGPFYRPEVAGPQVPQPWTSQISAGWSHQLDPSTVLDVDYVNSQGNDLGVSWALNTRVNGGARRYADLNLNPANPRLNVSIGASDYNGVNFGVRRRMNRGIQFNAWYTLAKATGRGGQAVDELTSNLVQDSTNPFADVQNGPAGRTDVRHRLSLSAVIQAPWAITISPTARFHSGRPIHIHYGYDNNADGISNDLFPTAYRYTGIDDAGVPSYKEDGPCETVNCGVGPSFSQVNVRVGKLVRLHRSASIEFYAEVFNLFNSINPAFTPGAVGSGAFYTGTVASHVPNTVFMKPNAFAGDAGNAEQRLGQLGFRFAF